MNACCGVMPFLTVSACVAIGVAAGRMRSPCRFVSAATRYG